MPEFRKMPSCISPLEAQITALLTKLALFPNAPSQLLLGLFSSPFSWQWFIIPPSLFLPFLSPLFWAKMKLLNIFPSHSDRGEKKIPDQIMRVYSNLIARSVSLEELYQPWIVFFNFFFLFPELCSSMNAIYSVWLLLALVWICATWNTEINHLINIYLVEGPFLPHVISGCSSSC